MAAFSLKGFSKWPSQLGFAATRQPEIIKEFAEIAREEYLSVGLRMALHPMSDLATEPRWSRNFGTFGSNAYFSSDMTLAYMKGYQGEAINKNSVLTMVKHFPGGGPQEDGLDALFGLIKEALPEKLYETAYALACDVAAADGKLPEVQLRFLEEIRHELNIDRLHGAAIERGARARHCLLYTSPSPRDRTRSRMPSSA